MEFTNQSSHEIGAVQDEKEKELQALLTTLFEVEQQILLLSRQIIDLQGKKKDLELSRLKANQNLKVLQSEMRVLKAAFWEARNSGL